jgi:tRNA (cmo5U34)-methyltransferase
MAFDNASLVTLNFTLQFIPLAQRSLLLSRIHAGLRPGGILILSEKIRFDDPQEEQLQIEMHHAFKRANGYNDLEISQKRSALDNVLIPETLEQHRTRLKQAGFRRADLWFQCFNFVSLVARG